MKVNVGLFLVIFLIQTLNSFSQENRLFESLEETSLVSSDSVFRLDLSKNKLTEFPIEIFKYKNLKELYLSKNKLTNLPVEFNEFKKLEILDLSKNEFSNFPFPLCSVLSLRQLFLGRNKITVIPECIGQLHDLEVLDIWYNQINGLPDSISRLKKLKNLDVRGVNFSHKTQAKIRSLLPWVKIEFDVGCDCGG